MYLEEFVDEHVLISPYKLTQKVTLPVADTLGETKLRFVPSRPAEEGTIATPKVPPLVELSALPRITVYC